MVRGGGGVVFSIKKIIRFYAYIFFYYYELKLQSNLLINIINFFPLFNFYHPYGPRACARNYKISKVNIRQISYLIEVTFKTRLIYLNCYRTGDYEPTGGAQLRDLKGIDGAAMVEVEALYALL